MGIEGSLVTVVLCTAVGPLMLLVAAWARGAPGVAEPRLVGQLLKEVVHDRVDRLLPAARRG